MLDLWLLKHIVFEHLVLLLLLLALLLLCHEFLFRLFDNFILTIVFCNGCLVFILNVDSHSLFLLNPTLEVPLS